MNISIALIQSQSKIYLHGFLKTDLRKIAGIADTGLNLEQDYQY